MRQLNSTISRSTVSFQLSVSVFGLILVILFATNPQVVEESFAWRKPLIGTALATVCVLGILSVFFPSKCSAPFRVLRKGKRQDLRASHAASLALAGHHPQCSHYSGHVLTLGRRRVCATCSGLFIGALIALTGVGVFFFSNIQIRLEAMLAVAVGVVGVALGLLQSLLPRLQNGVTRLFTGTFFVAGTSLILIGIEEVTRSVSMDLFVVALSVLWLMTKISLSQRDHMRICSRCSSESCSLKSDVRRKDG